MIRKNSELPVGSEAGSGARSRTSSGVPATAASLVSCLVSSDAVPGLAALAISSVVPRRPPAIAP